MGCGGVGGCFGFGVSLQEVVKAVPGGPVSGSWPICYGLLASGLLSPNTCWCLDLMPRAVNFTRQQVRHCFV